ncbi:MAG: hypothetical protein ACREBS_00690 [Nitrososphaerales archaeon]
MVLEENRDSRLPKMSRLEREVYDFYCEAYPASIYSLGLDEFAGRIMILSKNNIENALKKIAALKRKCSSKDILIRKFLDSVETAFLMDEPAGGVSQITEIISTYLIKEGFNADRIKKLVELLTQSLAAWLDFLGPKKFSVPVKILAQYQVLGALEIIDLIERESKDPDLNEEALKLRDKITEFREKYAVPGFTEGEFYEVEKILSEQDNDLGRERFYPHALRFAFDYSESWRELERNALKWMDEDLPKLKETTKRLASALNCNNDPESVEKQLKARPGMDGKQALETTKRIRPVIQSLVAESIVGINSKYDTRVVETPAYLTPIIPTAAAQGFDGLTGKPYQMYYLTTDPKRAPPGGLADLINTLVHEEYGHCVHFSNTAMKFAAKATIAEILPSLHSGTTSEGLAFQRELEFMDLLGKIAKKKTSEYTKAESEFVCLIGGYGGFDRFLEEIEFATYRCRIIRFLRVIGDTRINSGKQNLLEFLKWAEKKTGLSQRTVFYQIFPAHEGIFPGYATCYAIVGQDIRAAQKLLKKDSKKLVKFNAYACSMGYPPRSIYIKRLREYARRL